jgi:hypothetical protein
LPRCGKKPGFPGFRFAPFFAPERKERFAPLQSLARPRGFPVVEQDLGAPYSFMFYNQTDQL